MDPVGPLRSRLALPERAAEVAAPLVEGWDGQVPVIDATAYAPVDEAAYVYRQRRDGSEHLGLVLEVRRGTVAAGRLRGHEAVVPERVESLARELATGHRRTSLVSALHQPGPGYLRVLAAATAARPALAVTTADGGAHTFWRVADDAVAEVTAELSDSVLYVADGHHRLAATRAFWETDAGFMSAGLPVALYPLGGLRLEPFHRVLPGPLSREQLDLLQDLLRAAYDVTEAGAVPTPRTGQVAMHAGGRWLVAAPHEPPVTGVTGLDAVLLERHVLGPSGLGPARPVRAALTDLARRCKADGSALFALAPPAVSTLTRIADRGEVMPAKTTSFQPKPVSGLLLSA